MRRNRLCCGATVAAALLGCGVGSAQGQIEIAVEEALHLDDYSLVHVDVPQGLPAGTQIAIEVDGADRVMTIFKHSDRGENFQAIRSDGTQIEPPPLHTYRGMLNGVRGSRVAVSLYGDQLKGAILIGEAVWGVQPATDADPDAPHDLYVVYRMEDVTPGEWSCGVADGPGHDHHAHGATIAGGGTKICDISFDCDWEFYVANGQNEQNTIANTENVMNAVENIYLNAVNIGYDMGTIIVRDNVNDPYTTTNPNTLLNQFRAEWQTNQAGVQRDVAHLMTGRNIQGGVIGIAFLNGICNFNLQYGLSETTFTNNFAFRVGLTAHELGHNWSAGHCDGANDCGIMCSGIGGCPGGVTQFSNIAKAQITNFSNAIGCLDIIPDATATWMASVTTTNGDDEYQVGEVATMSFGIDFDPNVDGVNVLGLAATVFDVLGSDGASLGEIVSWEIQNSLADLTGDLTETDGTSLFNVNAGQLTAFGPFTDDDPIDVIDVNWSTEQVGPYDVTYETVTESMVIWETDNGDHVGVDWVVVEGEVNFDVIEGEACFADCTGDGNLDILDFVCFQAFYQVGDPYADCNGDGALNILDFVCFQGAFQKGCP